MMFFPNKHAKYSNERSRRSHNCNNYYACEFVDSASWKASAISPPAKYVNGWHACLNELLSQFKESRAAKSSCSTIVLYVYTSACKLTVY